MHPGNSYESQGRETYLQICASMIQISLRIRVVFSESSLDKSGWPRVQSFFMQTTKALVRLRADAQAYSSHRLAHMSDGTFSHFEAHVPSSTFFQII